MSVREREQAAAHAEGHAASCLQHLHLELELPPSIVVGQSADKKATFLKRVPENKNRLSLAGKKARSREAAGHAMVARAAAEHRPLGGTGATRLRAAGPALSVAEVVLT